jgi:hypothetical protein
VSTALRRILRRSEAGKAREGRRSWLGGLPVAVAFTEAGFPVLGVNLDEGSIADVEG